MSGVQGIYMGSENEDFLFFFSFFFLFFLSGLNFCKCEFYFKNEMGLKKKKKKKKVGKRFVFFIIII
jgi:hypothetical protein